jgi:uncharacterized protein YbjQ (UPF0145 family)
LGPLNALIGRWKLASAIAKNDLPVVLQAIEAGLPAHEKAELTAEENKAAEDLAGYAKTVGAKAAVIGQRFDSSMNQVSQRFGTKCRIWTVIFAFLLAVCVQLDTFQLLKKLSADPQNRALLITLSGNLESTYQNAAANQNAANQNAAAPASATQAWQDTVTALNNVNAKTKEVNELLGQAQFDLLPPPCTRVPAGPTVTFLSGGAIHGWPNWFSGKMHLAGLLISGVLLSLGAPFWFNTLKSLLSLRSTVAEATDPDPKPPAQPPATGPTTAGSTPAATPSATNPVEPASTASTAPVATNQPVAESTPATKPQVTDLPPTPA